MSMERTLLIVDDEDNILAALTRVLRRDGYILLKAEDGTQALDILAQHEVGVIVADQRMPNMTGTELLAKTKDLYPDTVRIVLSGYSDLQTISDAINQGAIYKYISKPWRDDELRADVREGFERYEMKLENRRLTEELKQANRCLSEINERLERDAIKKVGEMNRSHEILKMSQNILEHIPVGLLGIDMDGIIVIANKYAYDILGGQLLQLIGSRVDEVLPPELKAFYSAARTHASSTIELSSPKPLKADYVALRSVSNSPGGIMVLNLLDTIET